MSNTRKLYAVNSTGVSYWKTTIIIIAPILLLVVISMIFNYIYPDKHGMDVHAFSMGNTNKDDMTSEARPKFIDIGTFTVNLSGEAGSQNLQTSIALKLTKPGLDGKIKSSIPEIMHHVNMVLQSKQSSELVSYEGKEKLAQQIKEQVEYVMGFRKTSPGYGYALNAEPTIRKNGISDVLFTSFIIQY